MNDENFNNFEFEKMEETKKAIQEDKNGKDSKGSSKGSKEKEEEKKDSEFKQSCQAQLDVALNNSDIKTMKNFKDIKNSISFVEGGDKDKPNQFFDDLKLKIYQRDRATTPA